MLIAAGLLIATAAVLLVLEPILRAGAGPPVAPRPILFGDSDDEEDPVQRRRDQALAALKEIEFDHATGKLSDADYQRLKERYTAEALEALRVADAVAAVTAPDATGVAVADDPVEQLIADARAKAKGKKFCSECGAQLEGSGKFCVECGTRVPR
jgi:hypothetical protein